MTVQSTQDNPEPPSLRQTCQTTPISRSCIELTNTENIRSLNLKFAGGPSTQASSEAGFFKKPESEESVIVKDSAVYSPQPLPPGADFFNSP